MNLVQKINPFIYNKVKRNNYYIIQTGNSYGAQGDILNYLHKHGFEEVKIVNDCDVILVFCPIVSRAGSDMDAALNVLNTCSESKPAVFMVLYHTFDQEKIVPDSSTYINRRNTLTLNLMFNEDDGLLKCPRNSDALAKIIEHFIPQKKSNGLWQQLCSWPIIYVSVPTLAMLTVAYLYYRRKYR